MSKNYSDQEKYERCVRDLGDLLHQGAAIFRLMDRDQVQRHAYTSTQAFLLSTLLNKGPMAVVAISRYMNLEKSSISRIIKILERDGLLIRESHMEDKRVSMVGLSDEGKRTALEIQEINRSYYESIIANLPKGHVREVMDSAHIFIDALKKSL